MLDVSCLRRLGFERLRMNPAFHNAVRKSLSRLNSLANLCDSFSTSNIASSCCDVTSAKRLLVESSCLFITVRRARSCWSNRCRTSGLWLPSEGAAREAKACDGVCAGGARRAGGSFVLGAGSGLTETRNNESTVCAQARQRPDQERRN